MGKKSLDTKYRLALHVLRGSTELKNLVLTDADRVALIQCKYDLSKHTLYSLFKDYSNDPFNERFNGEISYPVLKKFTLTDNKNNNKFKFRNYGDEYNPKHIKCSAIIDTDEIFKTCEFELLNEDELVYSYVILEDVEKIKHNFKELDKEQKTISVRNKIKGMY